MTGPSPPSRWTSNELEEGRNRAIEDFRKERIQEPLEMYLEFFDSFRGVFEDLIEKTVDLTQVEVNALDILSGRESLIAFRYLAGPPISLDDLMVLSDAPAISPRLLREDGPLVKRIVKTVLLGLDRRRFPWLKDNRRPTEAEKHAAIVASASLVATQQVATQRRKTSKNAQEERVRAALKAAGLKEVPRRECPTLSAAPGPGEFCMESKLGARKADIIVGLYDRRVMPIECKVSNSAINSIKRLNNDAAAKANAWITDFGAKQVVPTAVLSGVYKLPHLTAAQGYGLTLYWAHDLGALVGWIARTH